MPLTLTSPIRTSEIVPIATLVSVAIKEGRFCKHKATVHIIQEDTVGTLLRDLNRHTVSSKFALPGHQLFLSPSSSL